VVLALVGAAYLYARFALPAETTHTRSITLHQSPEAVFALLADWENMPKWNRNMEKIELLPPIDGRPATRQTFNGNMTMTIITREAKPPTRLVRTMADDGGPFVGSWTYEITPTPTGSSRVVLTEDSEINSPFFRLMMKLFDPRKYMDAHLEDMAKHFGETATVE
jgi:uncharacterized protein YndB with AHSA1/START domain